MEVSLIETDLYIFYNFWDKKNEFGWDWFIEICKIVLKKEKFEFLVQR